MDDIMKIPFSEVKEDALKQIEDTIRRMGGKGGKRYLEDTCRNGRFDPESVRMSNYCMGDKWDRELLTSIHKSALEINRATGPSDLIEYSSRILNRKVCDSYYGELTALCNGTLLIINDTVYSCCCERFAREIAYGKGFIMRSQFFPVSDGEIGEFPDVLPFGYTNDGMSIHRCPFCGSSNLLYDAERSIRKRGELKSIIGMLGDRLTEEDLLTYRHRMEHSGKNRLMEIHRKAILCASRDETPLIDAVRDEGTLDHIIMRAESCSEPKEAAAEYLWCIANWHPFVEGNKRTAYLAAQSALGDRAIACADVAESERFIRAVALGTVSKDDIRSMIDSNTIKCHGDHVVYAIRTQKELLRKLSE